LKKVQPSKTPRGRTVAPSRVVAAKAKEPHHDLIHSLQGEQRELLRQVAALLKQNDDELIDQLDARLSRHAIAKEMLYGAVHDLVSDDTTLRAREEWAVVELLLARLRRSYDDRQRTACAQLLHDWLDQLFEREAKVLTAAARLNPARSSRFVADLATIMPMQA
jgi:hypothetical protein